jgi:hypothetical protein
MTIPYPSDEWIAEARREAVRIQALIEQAASRMADLVAVLELLRREQAAPPGLRVPDGAPEDAPGYHDMPRRRGVPPAGPREGPRILALKAKARDYLFGPEQETVADDRA